MEKTAESLEEILQGLGIKPPNLEDAGLEDCALPHESILEAFSRAARSLKPRVFIGGDDEYGPYRDCVQDPGPSNGDIPDALIGSAGGGGGGGETLDCGGNVTAAGEEEKGGDAVVVVGEDAASDRVVVLGGDEIDAGEKKWLDVDDEDDDDDKPILVEGQI